MKSTNFWISHTSVKISHMEDYLQVPYQIIHNLIIISRCHGQNKCSFCCLFLILWYTVCYFKLIVLSLVRAHTDWYLSLWGRTDKFNVNPNPENQVLTCQTTLFSTKCLHNAGYSKRLATWTLQNRHAYTHTHYRITEITWKEKGGKKWKDRWGSLTVFCEVFCPLSVFALVLRALCI